MPSLVEDPVPSPMVSAASFVALSVLRVVFSGSARLKVQGDRGLGLLVGKRMWAGGCHECIKWRGREQRTSKFDHMTYL
jgi:hypothetical protein